MGTWDKSYAIEAAREAERIEAENEGLSLLQKTIAELQAEVIKGELARAVTNEMMYSVFIDEDNDNALSVAKFDNYSGQTVSVKVSETEALQWIADYDMTLTESGKEMFADVVLPSPAPELPDIAVNSENQAVVVTQSIDFNSMMIDHYNIVGSECYIINPEQVILDEIIKRINRIETQAELVTAKENDNLEAYVDLRSESGEPNADLHLVNMEEGTDISIPITNDEKKKLIEAVAEYDREATAEKNNDKAEKKEKKSPEIERT